MKEIGFFRLILLIQSPVVFSVSSEPLFLSLSPSLYLSLSLSPFPPPPLFFHFPHPLSCLSLCPFFPSPFLYLPLPLTSPSLLPDPELSSSVLPQPLHYAVCFTLSPMVMEKNDPGQKLLKLSWRKVSSFKLFSSEVLPQ